MEDRARRWEREGLQGLRRVAQIIEGTGVIAMREQLGGGAANALGRASYYGNTLIKCHICLLQQKEPLE
jgi:hypothetical protein